MEHAAPSQLVVYRSPLEHTSLKTVVLSFVLAEETFYARIL